MKNKAIEKSNALLKFLKETDSKTKDIALQFQYGEQISDVVIRVEGDDLHLVRRKNAVEESHIQLNPTGIYLGSKGDVTKLGFGTFSKNLQGIFTETDKLLVQAIQYLPSDAMTNGEEIKITLNELSILAAAEAAQEQVDAATLSAAALDIVSKFKPENILDVKEEDGSMEISLRSKAYASAIADAVDEAGGLQGSAIGFLVDLAKRAGDTQADGLGLSFGTTAVERDLYVKLTCCAGDLERLVHDVLEGLLLEVIVHITAVDLDLSGAGDNINTSDG